MAFNPNASRTWKSITFSTDADFNITYSANSGTLGTVGGGITAAASGTTLRTYSILDEYRVAANQTWTTSNQYSALVVTQAAGIGLDLAANTLTLDTFANANSTIAIGSAISGTGAIVKSGGAGTAILSGANTYSGNTTISAGTLVLQGPASIANSPVVAVGSGAFLDVTGTTGTWTLANSQTLSGSGTILGNAAISGIHSPGSSPGIQSFSSNLTYSGGASSVLWELTTDTASLANRGISFDGIDVGGNLDFAGTTTLTLAFNLAGGTVDWSDVLWGTDQDWLLYDVVGTTTNLSNLGIFTENWADNNGALFNTLRSGSTFGLSQTGDDVYLNYTAGAIPEPSRMLLIGCGLIVGLLRRRR